MAGLTGVVVFGLLWELTVRVLDVEPFILMPPSRILSELFERPGFYLEAAAVTARQATVGLLIALALAIVLGRRLAASQFAEHAAQPVLVLILVAPWVAYFTSVVVWLGAGDPPRDLPGRVRDDAGVRLRHGGRAALGRPGGGTARVGRRRQLGGAVAAATAVGAPGRARRARYSVGLALAAAYYGEGGNLTTEGLGAPGGGRSTCRTDPCCGRR